MEEGGGRRDDGERWVIEEGVHGERQQVRDGGPMNPERNVDQEFTGEDNTQETEEREGNRMIFLHAPAKHSCRLRESGGNT